MMLMLLLEVLVRGVLVAGEGDFHELLLIVAVAAVGLIGRAVRLLHRKLSTRLSDAVRSVLVLTLEALAVDSVIVHFVL